MGTLGKWIGRRLRRPTNQESPPGAEEVFTAIYRGNAFLGKESVSGPGSDPHQTAVISAALPALFRELGITTLLDIPCGDFHWMRKLDLSAIDYMGAEIVRALVQENQARYASDKIRFQHLDLLRDPLPAVDLILCRDCLVHLPFADIKRALDNIIRSKSRYLLTTTFPAHTCHEDIRLGQWRAINLEAAPINLPRPLRLINEGCTEDGGIYRDKSLGLWRIKDLRARKG